MTTEEKEKQNTEQEDVKEGVKEEVKEDVKKEAKKAVKKEEKKEAKKKTTRAKKVKTDADAEKTGNTEKSAGKEEEKTGDENPLIVTFSVDVSKEGLEKDFNEALEKYAAEIKMPGFRKGRVPVEVIKSRYKEAITEEVEHKMVEKAVFDKIEKDKIRILSHPDITEIHHLESGDLRADVKVNVFPTVNLPDFETVEAELKADDLKSDPFDEEKQIDNILEGNKKQSPVVSRAIQDKDYVSLKFQSKVLKTKRMTPKKSTQFMVEKDQPSEILDLYDDIIGKKLDEEFTLSRTYPEDYKKKAWASQEIEHYITIESIFEMVKPEFNADFLKTIGFDDEEKFKAELKTEYEKYAAKSLEEKKVAAIIEKVCDVVQFPVPQDMVNQEMSRTLQSGQMPQFDMSDADKMKDVMENIKKNAESTIRFSFISEAIKEEHKLEAASEDLEKEYKNIAEQNKVPLKDVRKYYMQKENSQQLKEALVKNKIMDFLKEKVKIKEV